MYGWLFKDITLNGTLLFTASVIYYAIFIKFRKDIRAFNILIGLFTGIVGILLQVNSIRLLPDVMIDTRAVLLSVTGMFFGAFPTIIAAVIMCAFRIFLGGAGMLPGVFIIATAAVIGILWRQFRFSDNIWHQTKVGGEFYLLGLVTHLVMLACMFLLPRDQISSVLKTVFLPVLLVMPVCSLLLSLALFTLLKNVRTESDLQESELRLRTIYEQVPIGVAVVNDQGVLDYNGTYIKILGLSEEEIRTRDWRTYTHPDDLNNELRLHESLISGAISHYSLDKRVLRPDGSTIWVYIVVAPLKINNYSKSNRLCLIQDITEGINAKRSLAASERKYRYLYHEYQKKQLFLQSLINSIPDQIYYKDTNGVFLGCNMAFEKLTGLKEDQMIGLAGTELLPPGQSDSSLSDAQEQVVKFEQEIANSNGSLLYVETLETPYYGLDQQIAGTLCISRDITERKKKEEEILYLNYHDVLTGLYNRAYFDSELARLDTERQLPISVITGDVNGLKLINDAFGHSSGDNLLIEIAKILKSSCRAEDIIARVGGDEFSILLPQTDSSGARAIFERIQLTCDEYAEKKDKIVPYTSISMGYATKTTSDQSFIKVISVAEEYLYRRKLLEHKSLHSSILSSIKSTMFEKSNETEEHAERLAELSKELGRELGLDEEELVALELVSTLHDIGKISVDRSILTKPGVLNEDEWLIIRKHPEVGYRITQATPELRSISEYILCHHERWDGLGYPQGLAGEDIPLLSRILSVVDAYDAMTQFRSYRQTISKEAAAAEIARNAGSCFDPAIARVFIEKVLKIEL